MSEEFETIEPEHEEEENFALHAAAIVEGTLMACGLASNELKVAPSEVAHHVITGLMMFLADANDEDNLLCMVKKNPNGWLSHIHYDYLSADHDHFKGDFDWGVPPEK